MRPARPIAKDLVLMGGGHTHAIVLRKLGMQPLSGVRLTLITNLVDTPYSGMLPCHISGLYDFDASHIDLRPLSRFANCQLMMDRAVAIDVDNQQVICAHHPPVAFDVLSIDTGSTPTTVNVPGAQAFAIPAKPVPDLLKAWEQFLSEVKHSPPRPISLAVVGGGVGGVELTFNMQVRLWQLLDDLGRSRDDLTLHLFHRGDEIANGRNRSTRKRLHRRLVERGVKLHLQESVCAVEEIASGRRLRCESGLTVTCDRVFWVTNASAPDWLQDSGLATDAQGFLLVKDTLQSVSQANIFAAGDVATMKHHVRPKAGVFAVRQGPPLFHNLQAFLQGQPLKPFTPQKQYLNIIDTGDGRAIASRGPFTLESKIMRVWKDRIDRKFMGLFSDFPAMEQAPPIPAAGASAKGSGPTMYCAGCGSKVGSEVLSRALARLEQQASGLGCLSLLPDQGSGETGTGSGEVLIGLSSPDDAAVVRVPPGKLMVHTVDFFNSLVTDPFVFGQIVVKHCLNDLYAMGANPQTVLAIATLPHATPDKQTETLFHLLAGVQKALITTPTQLVGGHTTEGAELSLGLACNGFVEASAILQKGGMQPGNALILTQPLGTGTLFAADMQQQAKGRWIENAIAHMIQPSERAMQCLRQHRVTACTDVTGFGLLGHLVEMVKASQVSVELNLQDLPLLAGAMETLHMGLVSSLQSQNLQAAQALRHASSYISRPDYPILFDPQTAGGLLAAVPSDCAADCVTQLRQQGYRAATHIGTVQPLGATPSPITIKAW